MLSQLTNYLNDKTLAASAGITILCLNAADGLAAGGKACERVLAYANLGNFKDVLAAHNTLGTSSEIRTQLYFISQMTGSSSEGTLNPANIASDSEVLTAIGNLQKIHPDAAEAGTTCVIESVQSVVSSFAHTFGQ